MATNNSGNGSSGSKSQQGPDIGSGNESKNQSDKSGRSSEKQQDQSSSKQNSPGSTRGGTHEQHVKAGEQSHKNK